MSNVTQLYNTTPEELLRPIQELRQQLEELKKNFQPKEPEEFLSRAEVAKLLKVDISTIHNWGKAGKLKRHGLGNRVYYKRSEVEQAIQEL